MTKITIEIETTHPDDIDHAFRTVLALFRIIHPAARVDVDDKKGKKE